MFPGSPCVLDRAKAGDAWGLVCNLLPALSQSTDRCLTNLLKLLQTTSTDQESMVNGAGGPMTQRSGSAMAVDPPATRIFAIEIHGTAILAVEAATMREAMELCRESGSTMSWSN